MKSSLILALICFIPTLHAEGLLPLDNLPDYSFDGWENQVQVVEQGLRLEAPNARGGFGFTGKRDLSAHMGRVPELTLNPIQMGNSRNLQLRLMDADRTRASFRFRFFRLEEGEVHVLAEQNGFMLDSPEAVDQQGEDGVLDLENITNIQFLGDWRPLAVTFLLHRLRTLPDAEEFEAKREAHRNRLQREADEAAAAERALAERMARLLEEGAHREEDGPWVERVWAVRPNLLAVEIREFEIISGGQVDLDPDDPREIRPGARAKEVLAWVDGEPAMTPKFFEKIEQTSDGRKAIGIPLPNVGKLWLANVARGQPLERDLLQETEAWRVHVEENRWIQPLAVHLKSKPVNGHRVADPQELLHTVYLELPEALETNQTVQISPWALNTRAETVPLEMDFKQNRNEALQVSQIGYRPDDPFKSATLSMWLGTGGALSFDDLVGQPFYLLPEGGGDPVEAGQIHKARDVSEIESSFRNARNHSHTHIYHLDFSNFSQTGTWRVYVPGVGVSFPFPIEEDAWASAFRTSMMGFLHHRSGIELGPPLTDYIRPLGFHPDAGTRLFQADVSRLDGESAAIFESLNRLRDTPPEVPEAWGGYMDAGDWDRRSMHMVASFLQLELLEMFPEAFQRIQLAVPESGNGLPDLLNEALWNIDFYHRLQMEDGGVRGGVESTEHPRDGEASWQESLLVGVFSPDPNSSYWLAVNGAKAAVLLRDLDADRGEALAEAAERAWNWARENEHILLDPGEGVTRRWQDVEEFHWVRRLAALELYALTGSREYHDAFAWDELILEGDENDHRIHRHVLFRYATLPPSLGDAHLRTAAKEAIVALGEIALRFQAGNAYHLATDAPNLPLMGYVGYFSVPGMITPILPRAHFLTDDERFLAGAVGAANFSAGANPNNMVYTTGVGRRQPQNPLHIDSRYTAQPAPAGITVYGQSDPQMNYGFNEWVHTWQLTDSVVPPSRTWPTAESYFDIFLWPAQSEYTIHQTIGPTAYHWGYLAGRAARDPE
ncbi:MAG: glycoside hydrolase family 9 protein [Verrucomicrobia bacterium]|nr:glycoside hydrolase family 9 protein [Verrucomicrobiota bacterium]MCH8513093.1 glycoside hydrolase family 9 protein [Kiritimatiellia bacterium]